MFKQLLIVCEIWKKNASKAKAITLVSNFSWYTKKAFELKKKNQGKPLSNFVKLYIKK